MASSITTSATTLEGQLVELVAEAKRLEIASGQTPRSFVGFDLEAQELRLAADLPISLGASDSGWKLTADEFIAPLLSELLNTPDYSIFAAADFIAGIPMGPGADVPRANVSGTVVDAPFPAGIVSELVSSKGNIYNADPGTTAEFVGSSLRLTSGSSGAFKISNISVANDELYAVAVGVDDFSRVAKEINLLYQLAGHQPKMLKNGNLLARYQRPNNQQIAEEIAVSWLPNEPNIFVVDVRANEIDYWLNGAKIHTLRPGTVTVGNKRHDIYLKEADLLFQGTWKQADKPDPRLISTTLKDAFKSASFS
ncbi:MAG: hypothetical protein AAFS06_05215 [Cyanobacteria bacterium J06631_12]